MTDDESALAEVLATLKLSADVTTFSLFMVSAQFLARANLCTWDEIADAIDERANTTPDEGAAKALRDNATAIRKLEPPRLTLV